MSTRTGTKDALGGDVVQAGSIAALPTQDAFFTGSVGIGGGLTVGAAITATTTVNATTNVSGTGSVFGGTLSTPNNVQLSVGSPYGKGVVIQFPARANISGGMWVACSGGLALPVAAAAMTAVGVAQPGTNVASGGTVNVIVQGIVPMIAEGTVTIGGGAEIGAGAALNTIKPHAAGSAQIFSVVQEAGSESTAFILIR